MKAKKHFLVSLFLVVMFSAFSLAVVSCKKEPETPPPDYGEDGTYYFDAGHSEYQVTLKDGLATLWINGENESGVYAYDGANFTLTLDGASEASVATLSNGVLMLEYEGAAYRFLKKVNYTVSYDSDGGSAVQATTVLNGKTLSKPEDPAKDGFVFVGWYTDADYTMPFAFNGTPITSNTTLYARYIAETAGDDEYEVTFVVDGAEYATRTTLEGVVCDFPANPQKTDATFAGWWVSDFQNAEKLTYKYSNQILTEATTLYAVWNSAAPLISVTDTTISWSSATTNASYALTIVAPSGTTLLDGKSVGTTTYNFDFASREAGEYKIVVQDKTNNAIGEVYYNNKGLDRVSNFRVSDTLVLFYNAVPNAQKYELNIDCGNDLHDHSKLDNGKSTYYNFSNCEMQEGGIAFTVTASAAGYASSVSETFYYSRELDSVENLTINGEVGVATWRMVENATSYVVTVKQGGNTETFNVGAETTFSIREYVGEFELSVYPVARGYNSSDAVKVVYNNTKLATPKNVLLQNKTLTWESVENATSYIVKIGNYTYPVTENRLALTSEHYNVAVADYEVSVQAVGENGVTSYYSDLMKVKLNSLQGAITYSKGIVSWSPVIYSYGYAVRVNGKESSVEEGKTSATVKLTKQGVNKVGVGFYDDMNRLVWTEIDVYAYAIEFDTRGGSPVDTQYKALGDPLELNDSEKLGYDFSGWYNVPGGASTNGKLYTVDSVCDGAMVLYAYWAPKAFTVTLMKYGEEVGTEVVYYEQEYVLPVVDSNDSTKTFYGWFAEENSQGVRYTNAQGQSIDMTGEVGGVWRVASDRTLYAGWIDIITFTKIPNRDAYMVEAGGAIDAVTEITIPVKYGDDPSTPDVDEGLPVTEIPGSAFQSCKNLLVINIPDTITSIAKGAGGTYTGSPFQYCDNLREINVYETEGNHDRLYSSQDGVLFFNNTVDATGGLELMVFPDGKTGPYSIPVGTQVIPTNAFYYANVTEILIPYTVKRIDSAAFARSELVSVTFSETPEPEDPNEEKTEIPLTFGREIFLGCSKLITVDLPARLTELDLDVFKNCSNLSAINLEETEGEVDYTSKDGMLCDGKGTTLLYCPKGRAGDVTIPSGVRYIGKDAFKDCKKIQNLTIPAYVEKIGESAFENCTALLNVTFEGGADDWVSALAIETAAFYNCSSLTEIVLPANLQTLGANVFGKTSKLTKVTVLSEFKPIDETDDSGLAFKDNAFMPKSGETQIAYVKELNLGAAAYVKSIPGVFGTALTTVNVDKNNLYYSSVDGVLYNKNVTALVYYPSSRTEAYVMPDTVEEIGASVFAKNKNITEITIGEKVRLIGESAFSACSNLKTVTIKASNVELTIGKAAFKDCSSLEGITLHERTREIGEEAFYGCSDAEFTQITIPEGVTTIGDKAFYNAANLVTVNLPATLTKMGGYTVSNDAETLTSMEVFKGCSDLATITIPEANTSFMVIDGVLYLETDGKATELIMSPLQNGGTNGVVDIPKTVTKIWDSAFATNEYILEIKFSEGLETGAKLTIGAQVFYKCVNLREVELPIGVTTIGKNMFDSCQSLETVTVPYTVATIEVNAFKSCEALREVIFGEVPNGVEDKDVPNLEIGNTGSVAIGQARANAVFSGCTNLTTLNFPARLYKIGGGALYQLKGLATLSLGGDNSRLIQIGTYALYQTGVSGEIVIPDDVTTIEYGAFSGVANVTKLTLPSALTTLGNSAFSSMSALEIVVVPETLGFTVIPQNSFESCTSLKAMMTAEALEAAYEAVEGTDKAPELIVNIPEGITSINLAAFASCNKMEKVILPTSIQTVGMRAFQGTKSMHTIEFLETSNLKEIYNMAFQNSGLTSFTFPNTENNDSISFVDVEDQYDYIFSGCKSLTTMHLSKAVANIDTLFGKCYSITEITVDEGNQNFALDELQPYVKNPDGTAIRYAYNELEMENGVFEVPDGTETIGAGAFANQVSMKEIVIPASVRAIGDRAFENCLMLEKVTFKPNSTLEAIGQYAFYYCGSLKTIEIPESVVAIGERAFSCCSSLKSVTIKGNPTVDSEYKSSSTAKEATLRSYLFEDCTALETVTADKLTVVGQYMFDGCTALESVSFPEVTIVESYAFTGCTSLVSVSMPKATEFVTRKVTVASGEITSTPGSYFFRDCSSLNSVTLTAAETLGSYAFSKCLALTSISLPNVTEIGNYTFQHCASLTTVSMPKLVTMGEYAFGYSSTPSETNPGCAALQEISLPALEYIGKGAFQNCKALEKVSLPKVWATQNTNATTKTAQEGAIPANVFSDCSALWSVDLGAKDDQRDTGKKLLSLGPWGTSTGKVFANCSALRSIEIPDTVIALGNYTFQNAGLTTIKMPDSLTHLAQWATKTATTATFKVLGTSSSSNTTSYVFDGCKDLTLVDLNNVTLIGAYSFRNCTSLLSVDKLSNVTGIAAYAFYGCSSLLKADVSGVTDGAKLGYGMFYNCSNLSEVTLNNNVKILANYMFYGTTNLKSITLPTSLTDLGTYTFRYSGLESVTIPTGVTSIGTAVGTNVYTFADCANLSTVTLNNVTKVGAMAFAYCGNLTTIDLSKLTLIGKDAFNGTALTSINLAALSTATNLGTAAFANCAALASVTLNDNLTEIKNYMFDGCTSLTTLTLPTALTKIGQYAFQNSGLTSLALPNDGKFKTIDNYAFAGCVGLTTLALPDSLTTIGKNAFASSGLTTLTIPAAVTSIGTDAFNACPLTLLLVDGGDFYRITDGILYSASDEIICVPAYIQGEIALIDGVTISVGAFANNTKITKVILPETLETIPNNAFEGCTGLLSITIPASVTSIGTKAFMGCTNLVTVELLGQGLKVGTSAFEGCTSLENLTIAEGVSELGDKSFYGATSLTSVTIPNSMVKVGKSAFATSGVETLNLPTAPEELVVFANEVFKESQIQSLYVPDTTYRFGVSIFAGTPIEEVEIVGATPEWNMSPFINCVSLTTVTIGEGVTKLANNMFQHCSSLTDLTLPSTLEEISQYAFQGTPFTSFEVPEGITTIGNGAFKDCLALTTFIFSEGVTSIGTNTFENCTLLESVELPQSLTTIGKEAFKNSGLKSVTIPANVTSLGAGAFGTVSLTSVEIAATAITTAGTSKSSPFLGTETLAVTFAESVRVIPKYLFSGCMSISEIVIPDSVTELQTQAFSYSSITSVDIPGTVEEIGSSAFIGCESLTTVTLREGIKKIGSSAFESSGVTSIVIPSTVTLIDSSAFELCQSLSSFRMIDGTEDVMINYMAMENCINLTTVVLASNVTSIKHSVFENCTLIREIVIPRNCCCEGAGSTGAFDGWISTQTIYFECSAYELLSYDAFSPLMLGGSAAKVEFNYVAPNA